MRRQLARIEARADRWFAARRGPVDAVIEPYFGYSTPTHWIARGRVLARIQGHDTAQDQGLWRNLRGMATLFATDEVAGAVVQATGHDISTTADDEGYFSLPIPRGTGAGWITVTANAGGAPADLPVYVTPPDASFGVISDIDDTVMLTGAWSLARNLWTTFTGNVQSREVFPDAVRLIARLTMQGRNPVFYVSSSPWNLHRFLVQVMQRAGLVRGPMFLRDLGLNEAEVLGGSHHSHKSAMIDRILAANPELPFILIGDTGQKDAAIYSNAAARHPGRIARVILRRAGGPASERDVAALRALAVPVAVVASFDDLAD
jgi:phosphatidate phosphatase APP1